MNKLLVLGFALALGSLACGSSDDNKTNNTGTAGTGGGVTGGSGGATGGSGGTSTSGTCQGAASNVLLGSCTVVGQCFEMYGPSAPTADMTKAMADACTTNGGSGWSGGKCTPVSGGCTCTDTSSTYKTILYFSMAAMCDDCIEECMSKK